jgi:hypothetical protein
MATRLPILGTARYCASSYGFVAAGVSGAVFAAACASALGAAATAPGAGAGCWAMRLASDEAIETDPANIASPATGPSRISSVRFVTAIPFSYRAGGIGQGYPDRSPVLFVMTSKICPSGDFRMPVAGLPKVVARLAADHAPPMRVRVAGVGSPFHQRGTF